MLPILLQFYVQKMENGRETEREKCEREMAKLRIVRFRKEKENENQKE